MDAPTAVAEQPTEAPAEEIPARNLNVNDRCDSCGGQAYVSVLFDSSELLFCNHHFRKNEAKLRERATLISDESYKLYDVAKLDVSA